MTLAAAPAKTLLASALLALPILASAQSYRFTFDPAQSVFQGASEFRLNSLGGVIGAYNPQTNPNGTRTKPGLTGSFGPTENHPVRVAPQWRFQGQNTLRTSGGFALGFTAGSNRIEMTGYRADRLSGASARLSSHVTLNNAAFRTQAPVFAYPASVNPIGLGGVEVDRLTIAQKAERVEGTARSLGNGRFEVRVPFVAVVSLNVKQFGQSRPVVFEAPYSLVGEVKLDGASASYRKSAAWSVEEAGLEINRELQPFNFQIPAGTNAKASLVGKLTLTRVGLRLAGVSGLAAKGARL